MIHSDKWLSQDTEFEKATLNKLWFASACLKM